MTLQKPPFGTQVVRGDDLFPYYELFGLDRAPKRVLNTPLNASAALNAQGTDSVNVAGSFYISSLFLPCTKLITGVAILNGTTVGTDRRLVALFDSEGRLLGKSAAALSAGADVFQEQDLLSPVYVNGPTNLYIALQMEGTTATMQKVVTGVLDTDILAGAFGTVPETITVPTTFTTLEAPIGYVY